jgi:cellulose synthase/poly-beta-1,6-N-acetylglucosamine synthase-like glycosyltransferase
MNVTVSILSTLIAVEFDMLYAVTHLGRDLLWHTAMFNDSNGYWRAVCLKALRLNPLMMAEDIEISFRAFKKSCTIVHDPSVVSYELAPVTWRAFWTQGLR